MLQVAVMVVMLVVAIGVIAFAGYAVARHQAQNAADLAALAAAGVEGQDSPPDLPAPCSVAGQVARRNGALVLGCQVIGSPSDFVVTVRVRVGLTQHPRGLPGAVTAEADAGPVR